MDKSQYTPMMQHYLELKEQNPDAILMYRLGDFYEMFFEDAKTVSRELGLVLTARAAGAEKAPMCGVPHHAIDNYLSRLVEKGYKVAICEQLEDPAQAKGLVERGLVRIVTPGTYMKEGADAKSTNYIAALCTTAWKSCLVFCELSTGEMLYQILDHSLLSVLRSLRDLSVSELVVDRSLEKGWAASLGNREEFVLSWQKSLPLSPEDEHLLTFHDELLKRTLEVLLGYLQSTQMMHMDHLQPLRPLHPDSLMMMDTETKVHLELTKSTSASLKAVSLWEYMDRCQTSMGSRMLKTWIESPLLNKEEIIARQDAVQTLLDQFLLREQLKDHLSSIYDLERLISRIACRSAGPRDVLQVIQTLEHAGPILDLAADLTSCAWLQNTNRCSDLLAEIQNSIVDEPPATMKDGGAIKPGFSKRLDELRAIASNSEGEILKMEAREKERSQIKSLKIGYNRVFGYYIEVRKSNQNLVTPELGYTPRQTLANATRYSTPELKDLENRILSAQDEKNALENELYNQILEKIRASLGGLHELARSLSFIDVITSLALLANDKGYVRPAFSDDHSIHVEEGRHPVLADRLSSFISNDWIMGADDTISLITGPNMGGKSTYLRQNALLAIMAQIGSFIPARKAILPIFDRIFTRIGASDDLLTGKSTFMVEMSEANVALHYATKSSLILFDEIGRGTATYDGMALAQAMLEYIDSAIQAKTLFSTHYHELTELEEQHEHIHNLHVDVKESKKSIEFLYRVVEGKADKSYGINVARLAHLPAPVLDRASDLLDHYEAQNVGQGYQPNLFVLDPVSPSTERLIDMLATMDADDLSARDALQVVYEAVELARKAGEEK